MRIITSFILGLFFVVSGVYGQTIHFVSICEFDDTRLGVQKDRDNMESIAKILANKHNWQFKTYYYNKSALNKAGIENLVGSISASDKDIIIFGYSGHGQASQGEFPIFVLGDGTAVVQEDVHEGLKRKGARLVVTIFDACSGIGSFAENSARARSINDVLFTHLFMNYKGDVCICSSKRGQYSYGGRDTGGYFTSSFVGVLRDPMNNNGGESWESILAKSKANARALSGQEAHYKINVQLHRYCTPDDGKVKITSTAKF